MKKKSLTACILLLTILIIGCNDGSDRDNKTINSKDSSTTEFSWINIDSTTFCQNAGGLANFYVTTKNAITMMHDFDSLYKHSGGTPVDALLNSYWIDSCVVSEMAAYLRAHGNDGIRIYMACDTVSNPAGYPGQAFSNKSNIFIFPTNFENTTDPNKSTHQTDRKSTLHQQACVSTFGYFKDYAIAEPMINKFTQVYRVSKAALSISVWVDSCVIYGLDALLKANPGHDGAFIKLGAYNTMVTPSQFYPQQSTILVLPSKDSSGVHVPDWHLIDNITMYFKAKGLAGALNHGELCPQICD